MFNEPTTLASVARSVGDTLSEKYGVDPEPIFRSADIATEKFVRPGARVPFVKMQHLWTAATEASGDPFFGLSVGSRVMPSDFFVLGHAWMASATLAGAMRRLCRYYDVLTTLNSHVEFHQLTGEYTLTDCRPDESQQPQNSAKDAGFAALLKLCEIAARKPVFPTRVALTVPVESKSNRYDELFQCPVTYGHDNEVWVFAATDMDEPLTGSIPDVASATDRIAEDYIASLDDNVVTREVRQLLIQMLPSGNADQEEIAKRLYRSKSTLQRQLSAENTNYRNVLETTRCDLAEQYLKDGDYTQAQIAFMVGFADQSNFARAFKRWTGVSPGDYQRAA
jgi:AraC-like DNA-binding protein